MSEGAKERLAKLIIAAERKHEETDEQDRLLDIADALLAAGVTLPEPEPEWRVGRDGNTPVAEHWEGRWIPRVRFEREHTSESEADAREYVARKLAKPLDVETLTEAMLSEAGKSSFRNGVRRVLELAQVGTVARPLPSREEIEQAIASRVQGSTWNWNRIADAADAVLALLNERAK